MLGQFWRRICSHLLFFIYYELGITTTEDYKDTCKSYQTLNALHIEFRRYLGFGCTTRKGNRVRRSPQILTISIRRNLFCGRAAACSPIPLKLSIVERVAQSIHTSIYLVQNMRDKLLRVINGTQRASFSKTPSTLTRKPIFDRWASQMPPDSHRILMATI